MSNKQCTIKGFPVFSTIKKLLSIFHTFLRSEKQTSFKKWFEKEWIHLLMGNYFRSETCRNGTLNCLLGETQIILNSYMSIVLSAFWHENADIWKADNRNHCINHILWQKMFKAKKYLCVWFMYNGKKLMKWYYVSD